MTDERGKLDNFLSKRKARTDDDRTTSFNEFYWRGWQHDLIAELTKARRTEGVAMRQEGQVSGGGGGVKHRCYTSRCIHCFTYHLHISMPVAQGSSRVLTTAVRL